MAWQLRQGSALVYVIWFAVAVPLVIVGLLLEPRWVGWLVLAWFLVLVVFTLAMRLADGRLRKSWADAAGSWAGGPTPVRSGVAGALAVPAVQR